MTSVAVPSNHLGFMVLCTVRYALGRSILVVTAACELVMTYRSVLDEEDVLQIVREVNEELASARQQGRWGRKGIDHATWEDLLARLGAVTADPAADGRGTSGRRG